MSRCRLDRAVLKSHAAGTPIKDLAEIFDMSEVEVLAILRNVDQI